jgi:hypothetical protein
MNATRRRWVGLWAKVRAYTPQQTRMTIASSVKSATGRS